MPYALCEVRLGIGQSVEVLIDLLEGVGQHENSDGNQEKTTHECDDPHISSDLLESRQK